MTSGLNFYGNVAQQDVPDGSYNIWETSGYTRAYVTLYANNIALNDDTMYGAPTTGQQSVQNLYFNNLTVTGNVQTLWDSFAWFQGNHLTNDGTFYVASDATAVINTHTINGTGDFNIGSGGFLDIKGGSVGSGQTIYMGASTNLNLDNPQGFHGQIDATPNGSYFGVFLNGLVADSFSYNANNSIMDLWKGNRIIDQISIKDNGWTPGAYSGLAPAGYTGTVLGNYNASNSHELPIHGMNV